ncbi:MAG TPA: hypothetical protein VMG99_05535 [Thermoplasmata archaeon]|nr:hypothetical protein [Thermoplasmata archaeon]
MAAAEPRAVGTLAPIAVVWCRQVDNEAESPGYTTIPEEFPGRRDTLETIRHVGNLTINVADTHDYWDPEPGQTLSYYPNLFLYPTAGGRHICVGRMFLSTEDRPRLGMKTLVFDTATLVESGDFGGALLRAHATMGSRSEGPRKAEAEPDPSVIAAVGEGFLFHRGSTEAVVLVAAEQWEAANRVLAELVRRLPVSLVALGAFLSFPYFLPEAKVNLHEFTESLPLALAIMRVPRGEAQGERHAKRLSSWEAGPVAVRDLTRPSPGRAKETLPTVLQYVRDHADDKLAEIARRVDLVELPRLRSSGTDPEHQTGRDRRKEMWRIGTAMETAALLIARPKGRTVPVSADASRRANEYLRARPADGVGPVEPTAPPPLDLPAPAASPLVAQLPPWLQRPAEVTLPPAGPVAVPVSISDDPSLQRNPAPPAVASGPTPGAPPGANDPDLEAWLRREVEARFQELSRALPPSPGTAAFEQRMQELGRELESKWTRALETRVREVAEVEARAILSLQHDLSGRLNAVEARPVPVLPPSADETAQQIRTAVEARAQLLAETLRESVRQSSEMWAAALKLELHRSVDELAAKSARSEEELRAGLVAQLDLELRETKEQATALREEVEGRVRDLLNERWNEIDQRRQKEVRDVEQRLTLLSDGRAKDLEAKLTSMIAAERERTQAAFEERVQAAERRLAVEQESRATEVSESQGQSLAGFQVRMQAFFEQKLRENQEREREKYVELLARFKGEVDSALGRTIDSTKFDAAVRERVARVLDAARADQEKTIASRVTDAEVRLRSAQEEAALRLERVESKLQQRETDLARIERSVRHDAEEIERRVQVLTDRMLPLVRKTWLKVGELEKAGPIPGDVEARTEAIRREMTRELRRIEGEMLEQTTELRDRLETTISQQGRIWLNFVHQLAEAGANLMPADASSGRSSRRLAPRPNLGRAEDADVDLRATAGVDAFAEDPANPLDPDPLADPEAGRDVRRRSRPRTGG